MIAEDVLRQLAVELSVADIVEKTYGTNICNWSAGPIQVDCQNVTVNSSQIARAQRM